MVISRTVIDVTKRASILTVRTHDPLFPFPNLTKETIWKTGKKSRLSVSNGLLATNLTAAGYFGKVSRRQGHDTNKRLKDGETVPPPTSVFPTSVILALERTLTGADCSLSSLPLPILSSATNRGVLCRFVRPRKRGWEKVRNRKARNACRTSISFLA